MSWIGWGLIAMPVLAFGWAYAGYPAVLWIAARLSRAEPAAALDEWPTVSICLPAYNEEAQIGGALDAILAVDYPRERLQVLVVSDASSDATDEIVRSYADRGIELLRVTGRSGKTAAENEAAPHLTGDVVVNTDASIRIRPDAVKHLVRALADPTVGVASGRDVSVAADAQDNRGEGGYVGYEMWVRSLETATGAIVGASGCFYATRNVLHRPPEPPNLSRDFASVLRAREAGYRSVHVHEAVCLVPRSGSIEREMGRKQRTMSRGLATLFHHGALLNPFRHGAFAMKLFSHKLCRWLGFLLSPLAVLGVAILALDSVVARAVLAVVLLGLAVGWLSGRGARPPRDPFRQLAAFGVATFAAGFGAWVRFIRHGSSSVWEPTRRDRLAGDGPPSGS